MANPAIFIAALGGILPALLWLAFWLLEDRCQPEPKRYILLSFIFGMGAVLLAMTFERQGMVLLGLVSSPTSASAWQDVFSFSFMVGIVEECLTFAAAYVAALRWGFFDEPLDAVIYLVTVALGFSALENSLFIWSLLAQSNVLHTIVAGDLRFIGATLLHTLTAATIGIAMALSFSRPAAVRRRMALVGVILAISLHTMFDFLIIKYGESGSTFWVFLFTWFGIIAALLMVERIKQPARDYC